MFLEKEKIADSVFAAAAVQKSFFYQAFHRRLPVAAWRLPHQQAQHVIVDLSGKVRQVPLELDALPAGFLVSPFLSEANPRQVSYLRADLHYSTGTQKPTLQTAPETTSADSLFRDILANALMPDVQRKPTPYFLPPQTGHDSGDKSRFTGIIRRAVQAIQAGDFQKVVPSRRKTVSLPGNFDLIDTFRKLCEAYPAAFVSVFSIPGVGTWMGASPEVLVSTYPENAAKIFRTVALAGTQIKKDRASLKNTAWRQKEIEEQALVSRYIINCFKKIRLREYEENGPKTVAAGNLIHLRTDFTVDMQATNFPELPSVMLDLLHPTSAVCGMPKEAALAFLQQQEGYDRAYFSGFLGPVYMTPDTLDIFVNLRCMQLLDQQAALYAGVGVTADSDPVKEWKETEAKMQTLLRML